MKGTIRSIRSIRENNPRERGAWEFSVKSRTDGRNAPQFKTLRDQSTRISGSLPEYSDSCRGEATLRHGH